MPPEAIEMPDFLFIGALPFGHGPLDAAIGVTFALSSLLGEPRGTPGVMRVKEEGV